MPDPTKRSRETAEQLEDDVERIVSDVGRTLDGLRHGPRDPEPPSADGPSGGDITININK